MKKYLVCLLLLVGCENASTVDGDIVIEIKQYDDKNSKYITYGKKYPLFNNEDPSFIAPIGLYNIRDTIKFSK